MTLHVLMRVVSAALAQAFDSLTRTSNLTTEYGSSYFKKTDLNRFVHTPRKSFSISSKLFMAAGNLRACSCSQRSIGLKDNRALALVNRRRGLSCNRRGFSWADDKTAR